MSWSLGETRSLATKAARGAGFTWGLAEEAGFAVHWLQAHGAPGAQALADLLIWIDEHGNELSPAWMLGDDNVPMRPFNPIELGAALMDANRCGSIELGMVSQPLLLAPFIAIAAVTQGCRLVWKDVSIDLEPRCFRTSASRSALLSDCATCRLGVSVAAPEPSAKIRRVNDSEGDAIIRLGGFAARTYAPATEQSRLAGAGAGLSDND